MSGNLDLSGFDPNHVEEVIVVVRMNYRYCWFKSDRELWVLDYPKRTKSFIDAGFLKGPPPDPSRRFGIPIVNEKSADCFLSQMRRYEINPKSLAKELEVRFPIAESFWDVIDLFPIMFVDFDHKHVCAFYPDGTPMERYIPDGWTSEFEDFATKYPESRFPQLENSGFKTASTCLRTK